jgi:hypothetical protein
MDRVGQALAVDPVTGTTILAWNEGGQVRTAYFNSDSGHWIDAEVIPGSASGQDLRLQSKWRSSAPTA